MVSLLLFLKCGPKKWPLTSQNSLRHAGLIDSTDTAFYCDETPLVPRTDSTSQAERGTCLWSNFRRFQSPWAALIHLGFQEEVQNREGLGWMFKVAVNYPIALLPASASAVPCCAYRTFPFLGHCDMK